MITVYLPIIAANDYDAFRHILHDNLPDTYDEWLCLAAEERTKEEAKGHRVINVEIYSDELADYLRSCGATSDRQVLRRLAQEKFGREEIR